MTTPSRKKISEAKARGDDHNQAGARKNYLTPQASDSEIEEVIRGALSKTKMPKQSKLDEHRHIIEKLLGTLSCVQTCNVLESRWGLKVHRETLASWIRSRIPEQSRPGSRRFLAAASKVVDSAKISTSASPEISPTHTSCVVASPKECPAIPESEKRNSVVSRSPNEVADRPAIPPSAMLKERQPSTFADLAKNSRSRF